MSRWKRGGREGDAPTEVEDFAIRVTTVHDAAEVEHLGSIVDLGPEAVLESLLLSFEGGRSLDEVEVGEDGDELGKTVRGEGGEGLEGFLSARRGSAMSLDRLESRNAPSQSRNFHRS